MKKLFQIFFKLIFILILLAIILVPAWSFIKNPELLAMPEYETTAFGTGILPNDLSYSNIPVTGTPTIVITGTPKESASLTIVVTGTIVNLRTPDNTKSGYYLYLGDEAEVRITGNWAEITKGQFKGFKVWLGCTNLAGNLGCQSD